MSILPSDINVILNILETKMNSPFMVQYEIDGLTDAFKAILDWIKTSKKTKFFYFYPPIEFNGLSNYGKQITNAKAYVHKFTNLKSSQ